MKVMAMFSNDEFTPPKDWTYFWCCKHEKFLFEKDNKIVVVKEEPLIDLVNPMEHECDTVSVEDHPRHPKWKVCVNCLDKTAQQLLEEGSVKNVATKY